MCAQMAKNMRAVRLPDGMFDEAEELIEPMMEDPRYNWAIVNTTMVIRRALQLGLDALRGELDASAGGDGK